MSNLPPLLRTLGLEIQEVAADANLDPSTVSRALHDKQRLSDDAVARLELAVLRRLSGEVK